MPSKYTYLDNYNWSNTSIYRSKLWYMGILFITSNTCYNKPSCTRLQNSHSCNKLTLIILHHMEGYNFKW